MNFTYKNNWKDFIMKEFEKNERFKELQNKMFAEKKMNINEWCEMIVLDQELKEVNND